MHCKRSFPHQFAPKSLVESCPSASVRGWQICSVVLLHFESCTLELIFLREMFKV